jgi:FixJ family two-component response regulator
MTGIELVEKLTADRNDVLFTLLAGHADAPAAVKAMQENVLDFLLKPVNAESLLGLVACAYAQYYDVDWDFVGEDLDDIEDCLSRITEREREVLDLLVEGYSSREIGSQLAVSTKTIEAHRARINDKMRSDDLAHLVRMVLASRDA